MARFLSTRSQNSICFGQFCRKTGKDKFSNFSSKPIALPLLKNNNFLLFWIHIFVVLNGYISVYKLTKHLVSEYFAEKLNGNKLSYFWPKTIDETLWKNANFLIFKVLNFLKFFWSKLASFLSRRSQNTLFRTILLTTKQEQNFHFLTTNYGLTPLENAKFSTFLNSCFVVLNG